MLEKRIYSEISRLLGKIHPDYELQMTPNGSQIDFKIRLLGVQRAGLEAKVRRIYRGIENYTKLHTHPYCDFAINPIGSIGGKVQLAYWNRGFHLPKMQLRGGVLSLNLCLSGRLRSSIYIDPKIEMQKRAMTVFTLAKYLDAEGIPYHIAVRDVPKRLVLSIQMHKVREERADEVAAMLRHLVDEAVIQTEDSVGTKTWEVARMKKSKLLRAAGNTEPSGEMFQVVLHGGSEEMIKAS